MFFCAGLLAALSLGVIGSYSLRHVPVLLADIDDLDAEAQPHFEEARRNIPTVPVFRVNVFTKAKNSAHHQFYTLRTDDDFDRFVYLVGKIEEAINTGIFFPVESYMNCAECTCAGRCKAVHRRTA